MNQKRPDPEDLIALGDETFDRMQGDPELIEMMRALWKLSVELQSEAKGAAAPDALH